MEGSVKDIGQLTGKVLVFGGAYSNLQALQKLQSIAEDLGIPSSNVINTGDAVGYCAQPQECLDLIKEWGIHSIAGNVEMQIRDGEEDCGCNFNEESRCDVFSRQWYPYALASVNESSKQWLKEWPDFIRFQFAGKSVFVLHGCYFNTSEFIFRSTLWEVKQKNFETTKADVILSGHCGLPFHDIQDDKYWLNAGVIGMPANDGTTRVWYMILDDVNGFQFSHEFYEYDQVTASQLMKENKLPASYAKTLTTGLWDNCEILPELESKEIGKRIVLQSE
ncbi:MAG: diadenosine tetraphosphatase [Flammeovirgaceae bacterium]|nr:diadenosine tetraphosphatase [Flammeovirgaceae bacterium]HCX24117.1 diadenosine tetraphosphatase [Cytophagales bacterium]